MPVAVPEPKDFPVYATGAIRDAILQDWRLELQNQIDPKTGLPFAEDDITRALQPGSRWYIEANALDQVCAGMQQRGLTLADQIRIDRANTEWLRDYHGALWDMRYLSRTGGFGPASGTATPGTIYLGSTTLDDPSAVQAVDPSGKRYQVFETVVTPGSGVVSANWIAIDGGVSTNLPVGTVLTLSANVPLGNQTTFTVTSAFTGGTDDETDASFAARLLDRIRHKPAAGNRAQMRSWARDSSNAIEDAFIYPCASYAGSTHVAIVQARSGAVGPLGRIPNLAVLTSATAYLTPPASPVVPARAHVVVTGVTPVSADIELLLGLPKNSASGWRDANPWPRRVSNASQIIAVGGTTVTINADTAPPTTTPRVMIWSVSQSRWKTYQVSNVTPSGPGWALVLDTTGLNAGDYVSPAVGRADTVAEAIEAYFDGLGPGELIDLNNDDRSSRAFRYPLPNEEYSYRLGRGVLTYIQGRLGAVLQDSDLVYRSINEPPLPVEVVDGPRMITLGGVGVYPI